MYLTNPEISQLKKNLMSKAFSNSRGSNRSTSLNTIDFNSAKISNIVSKEIKKIKNGEIGIRFEENIRKTLEFEYKWKSAEIPRHFYYRQIIYKRKIYYISFFLQIDAVNFLIKMDKESYKCLFVLKESDEVVLEIPENENIVQTKYSDKTFLIYPPKEFEADGIYQEFKWDELEFDGDEIKVLFDNTNFNEYPNSIIEVKLSAYKIDELIQQLKTDQIICEHMVNKNSVYIGFLNLTKSDFYSSGTYDYSEICGDMPCIIFGINNGTLCKRNITEQIDWKLIREFNSFRDEFKYFKEKFIPDMVEKLKNELKDYIHNEFISYISKL
jgi:hypothetical protein